MSISVTKIVNLAQSNKTTYQNDTDDSISIEYDTLGGILSDKKYAWLANGPRLEVISIQTGKVISSWTFGWILKGFECEIQFVDEIQRQHQRSPLLAIAVKTAFHDGIICIFDFLSARVIRAIKTNRKITSLHVVDAGCDEFNLPGPLRTFDGIIAVGVEGGDVYLVDICRQICEEGLTLLGHVETRDELMLCDLSVKTSRDIAQIELHKHHAVKNNQHLAFHLNAIFDSTTSHFVLKGQKGEDRLHVNKAEVAVSSLYYCPQLGSLLIGFNFGAFQLFNLINLDLVYTSPVCDEHIPITQFAFQEASDDPRADCYIWATYSSSEFGTCYPLAVLYVFCYETKEYHEGYGHLYENFGTATIHYQMELHVPKVVANGRGRKMRKSYVLGLVSNHNDLVKQKRSTYQSDGNEENVPLSIITWTVEFANGQSESYICVFDLNQWYKEQMPKIPNEDDYDNYMLQICLTDAIATPAAKKSFVLDILVDTTSFRQFVAANKLEEHFFPSALSFDLICLRESDVIQLHKTGIQNALLTQITSSGPLCLVDPSKIYMDVIALGLLPIFVDVAPNAPVSTLQQREIILGTALENHLIHWLCKCASDWANGSCLAAGCSLDLIINWAFQRAVTLKKHSFDFCIPLFDYSGLKLDYNTMNLLNHAMRQLNNICEIFDYIMNNLSHHILNLDMLQTQYGSLQQVCVYFKVVQWFYQVGLLPESNQVGNSDQFERITAPYPFKLLDDFYTYARDILGQIFQAKLKESQLAANISCKSFLYIDTLIEKVFGAGKLAEQWHDDNGGKGSGLYPPASIQSLLKTYLIDGADYSQVHLLIVYFCFDMSAALDENLYQSITTYLKKFPDSFGLNASEVKLTQAFWHLDHDNAEKAIQFLQESTTIHKDIQKWQHKVFLGSLLMQNQHKLALQYVQLVDPPLTDAEDIFAGITLIITNNMLDEALNFRERFNLHSKDDKYLNHLFNECANSGQLKSLIYNNFSKEEEQQFLDYLAKRNDEESNKLLVSYHVIRAQYLEAFETHENYLPHRIPAQGLYGQQIELPVDKVVRWVKQILPTTIKTMIETYKRERGTITRVRTHSTPMSVYWHNLRERDEYKSNVNVAILSKAKQTFAAQGESSIKSEEMPFLCAPKLFPSNTKVKPKLVIPNVKEKLVRIEEDEPTPAKRMKMSPQSKNVSASILTTPTIQRRPSSSCSLTTPTPHSILKMRHDTPIEEEAEEASFLRTPSKSNQFGLSPRKPLSRTTPTVRFEGVNSSTSSAETTKSIAVEKSTSIEEEETFYSPESSIEEKEAAVETAKHLVVSIPKLDLSTCSNEENSSKILPKLTPRKSLCRKVLETNALREVYNATADLSPLTTTSRKVVKEESFEKSVSYSDGSKKVQHSASFVEKHSIIELSSTDDENNSPFKIKADSFRRNTPVSSRKRKLEMNQSVIEVSSANTSLNSSISSTNSETERIAHLSSMLKRIIDRETSNQTHNTTETLRSTPKEENNDDPTFKLHKVSEVEVSKLEDSRILDSFKPETSLKRTTQEESVLDNSKDYSMYLNQTASPSFSDSILETPDKRVSYGRFYEQIRKVDEELKTKTRQEISHVHNNAELSTNVEEQTVEVPLDEFENDDEKEEAMEVDEQTESELVYEDLSNLSAQNKVNETEEQGKEVNDEDKQEADDEAEKSNEVIEILSSSNEDNDSEKSEEESESSSSDNDEENVNSLDIGFHQNLSERIIRENLSSSESSAAAEEEEDVENEETSSSSNSSKSEEQNEENISNQETISPETKNASNDENQTIYEVQESIAEKHEQITSGTIVEVNESVKFGQSIEKTFGTSANETKCIQIDSTVDDTKLEESSIRQIYQTFATSLDNVEESQVEESSANFSKEFVDESYQLFEGPLGYSEDDENNVKQNKTMAETSKIDLLDKTKIEDQEPEKSTTPTKRILNPKSCSTQFRNDKEANESVEAEESCQEMDETKSAKGESVQQIFQTFICNDEMNETQEEKKIGSENEEENSEAEFGLFEGPTGLSETVVEFEASKAQVDVTPEINLPDETINENLSKDSSATSEVIKKNDKETNEDSSVSSQRDEEDKSDIKTSTRTLRGRTISTESITKEPTTATRKRRAKQAEEIAETKPIRRLRSRTVSTESPNLEDTTVNSQKVRRQRARTKTPEIPEENLTVRKLRSRTISTEERQTDDEVKNEAKPKKRPRSNSSDDSNQSSDNVKPRSLRATSCQPELESIREEDAVEKYSLTRRVTRTQSSMLKRVNSGSKIQRNVSSKNIDTLPEDNEDDNHSVASTSSAVSSSTLKITRSSSRASDKSSETSSTVSSKRGRKKQI